MTEKGTAPRPRRTIGTRVSLETFLAARPLRRALRASSSSSLIYLRYKDRLTAGPGRRRRREKRLLAGQGREMKNDGAREGSVASQRRWNRRLFVCREVLRCAHKQVETNNILAALRGRVDAAGRGRSLPQGDGNEANECRATYPSLMPASGPRVPRSHPLRFCKINSG